MITPSGEGTASSQMRGYRISKQALANDGTMMVLVLFGPSPMTGRTPVERGVVAKAARNGDYNAGTTVPDYAVVAAVSTNLY
ncbi:hypothetical protein AVEN_263858-1 [Araneus ventricosus]|uniref:Uncharacterized protein n=1 Tax=Araneus ventricosus TaxID=182803 RepID=A0A4Y2QJI1_ARAVE|nr:hypothetical protein AVEN_263858-1 [Araneus ventricosus]